MEIERSRRGGHAVNLTPLIDIVFLLVVFFMLSTSFVVSESMELSIPSEGAKASSTAQIWVLKVQDDGTIFSDSESFSVNALDRKVRDKLNTNTQQKILVLASDNTSVQQLVTVLDVLYINGARKVQIDHNAKNSAANEVKIR